MNRHEWTPVRRTSRRTGWLEDLGFGATLAGIAAALLLQLAEPAAASHTVAAAQSVKPPIAAESSLSQSRPTSA